MAKVAKTPPRRPPRRRLGHNRAPASTPPSPSLSRRAGCRQGRATCRDGGSGAPPGGGGEVVAWALLPLLRFLPFLHDIAAPAWSDSGSGQPDPTPGCPDPALSGRRRASAWLAWRELVAWMALASQYGCSRWLTWPNPMSPVPLCMVAGASVWWWEASADVGTTARRCGGGWSARSFLASWWWVLALDPLCLC